MLYYKYRKGNTCNYLVTGGNTMGAKTFKLNDETVATLEQISKELGLSWDGTFSTLSNLYVQQQAVSVTPERKGEVEHFQTLLNQLGEAFANALTVNANTDERIRQEYQRRLLDMENKVSAAEEEASAAKAETARLAAENEALKAELTAAKKAAAEAETLTAMQQVLADLQKQVTAVTTAKKTTTTTRIRKTKAKTEDSAAE